MFETWSAAPPEAADHAYSFRREPGSREIIISLCCRIDRSTVVKFENRVLFTANLKFHDQDSSRSRAATAARGCS